MAVNSDNSSEIHSGYADAVRHSEFASFPEEAFVVMLKSSLDLTPDVFPEKFICKRGSNLVEALNKVYTDDSKTSRPFTERAAALAVNDQSKVMIPKSEYRDRGHFLSASSENTQLMFGLPLPQGWAHLGSVHNHPIHDRLNDFLSDENVPSSASAGDFQIHLEFAKDFGVPCSFIVTPNHMEIFIATKMTKDEFKRENINLQNSGDGIDNSKKDFHDLLRKWGVVYYRAEKSKGDTIFSKLSSF